jgi:2-oxoglutarate dehydrogenase E2 component (dihydrolipoamide succinyltransferase)
VISKILRDTGETVTSNELLGIIEEGVVEAATEAVEAVEVTAQADVATVSTPAIDTAKLSPAARRIAEEEKTDISSVSGTGRGGRITKGDLINHVRITDPSGPRPEQPSQSG